MTTFRLAVWSSERVLSSKDASRHYHLLATTEVPEAFSEAVYGFCSDLTRRFPDPDTLPEDQVDSCPWACALEFSGCHVMISLLPDRYPEVFPYILELADRYELTCYDPQNEIVHPPAGQSRQETRLAASDADPAIPPAAGD